MKPTSSQFTCLKKAAIACLLVAAAPIVSKAEDLTYTLKRDIRIENKTTPAEGHRYTAFKRVQLGFNPYLYENRNASMYNSDKISTHVLAVHLRRVAGQIAVYPGHSLAPDLSRIVSR